MTGGLPAERSRAGLRSIVERALAFGPLGSLRWLRHELSERWSDWRLGIETIHCIDDREGLGLRNPEFRTYSPVAYAALRQALHRLEVEPGRDVLVDLGSGKGRVLVVAARLPFRRIVGIELCPALVERARENVRRARGPRRCSAVEVLQGDATRWQLPDDATVVHLFSPFVGASLVAVLDRVEESLRRAPRSLTLLFANPSHFERQAADRPWLRRVEDLPWPFAVRTGPDVSRYRIYAAGPVPGT